MPLVPALWSEPQEAEAGRSLSLSPAWSTGKFQDSQGYREKPCLGEEGIHQM